MDTIAAGLRNITHESAKLGLWLNLSKCELIVPAGHVSVDLAAKFPNELLVDERGKDRIIWDGGFEFLGAPIGSSTFCNQHSAARADQAQTLLTAISELEDPQVALRLQRRCQGFAKLGYSARVVPPPSHVNELLAFDAVQRDTFGGYMS